MLSLEKFAFVHSTVHNHFNKKIASQQRHLHIEIVHPLTEWRELGAAFM